MEHLVANLAGNSRYEWKDGRQYLVAPITIIVPGVLNGSQGRLYYPHEEIARNHASWNDVPIVVNHPMEDGRPISAADPGVYDQYGIGFLRRPVMENALIVEGWFDVNKTKRVDASILQNLRAGRAIEVSTGLFTENEPAEPGATFNGRAYDFKARNYRPDHLAILPDKIGACSVKDGCGVHVTNETDVHEKRSLWNTLGTMLGLTENAKDEDLTQTVAAKAAYRASSDAHDKTEWATRADDGNASAKEHYVGAAAAHRNAASLHKEAASTAEGADKVNHKQHGALHKQLAESLTRIAEANDTAPRDGFPIRNEDTDFVELMLNKDRWPQSRRDKTSKKDFAGPHESFPIETQQDVDSAAKLVGHAEDPEAVKSRIKSLAKKKGLSIPKGWESSNNSEEGDPIMAKLAPAERTTIVNALITNCGCPESTPKPFAETDRNTLNSLPDSVLLTLDASRKKLATNEGDGFEGAARSGYNNGDTGTYPEGTPTKININSGTLEAVINGVPTGSPQDAGKVGAAAKEGTKTGVRQMTNEEFLASVPPTYRSILTNAEKIVKEQKQKFIAVITANTANRFSPEWLATLDPEVLEGMAAMAQNSGPAQPQHDPRFLPNYLGQSAPHLSSNASYGQPVKEDDILEIPTINWGETAETKKVR